MSAETSQSNYSPQLSNAEIKAEFLKPFDQGEVIEKGIVSVSYQQLKGLPGLLRCKFIKKL